MRSGTTIALLFALALHAADAYEVRAPLFGVCKAMYFIYFTTAVVAHESPFPASRSLLLLPRAIERRSPTIIT